MLQRCHVWTFVYTGVDCPDISLFEDIVISFLLHVLDTSLCLPVIWSLLTVAAKCPCNWPRVSSSSFHFWWAFLLHAFFFYLLFFFLHYGNNYHYCSNMFQDISCHMRPVKGGFTFSSAQTNATFVKCKLAVIIDQNRGLLSCAPKLSFHFPT